MRLAKIGLGTLMAAAAFAMPAAPAQAQELCFDGTGTVVDGKCLPVVADEYEFCIKGRCVTGVQENVDAAVRLVLGLVPDIDDVLPVCTPHLLSGPICVG